MNNKYKIGDLVFIALRGFVLQTTIEAVQSDPAGNNCSYCYAGRIKKDGTAEAQAWEGDVFQLFDHAAERARRQREE